MMLQHIETIQFSYDKNTPKLTRKKVEGFESQIGDWGAEDDRN